MKDNRKSPFVSNPVLSLQTDSGLLKLPVLSYSRFNSLEENYPGSSAYIRDYNSSSEQFKFVSGSGAEAGRFTLTTGSLSDFNVYGTTVYSDITSPEGAKFRLPMNQAGISLPASGKSSDTEAKDSVFLVRENAESLDPSATTAAAAGSGITYLLKIRMNPTNAQSLLQIADPGSTATFSIGFGDTDTLSAVHRTNGGGSNASVDLDISSHKNKWVTYVAHAYVHPTNGVALGTSYLFDIETGDLLSSQAGDNAGGGSVYSLSKTNLYVGYGEPYGGVNVAFMLNDFLIGVDVAEVMVLEGEYNLATLTSIVNSHLDKNHYKSGFNNRAPRKVQQALDAKRSYPISANPAIPKETASPFNDTTTKVFGHSSRSIMFPEMLPAEMFSGSDGSRGAPGDTRPFYRDVHNTPFEKRIVAPGNIQPSLSHKETELLNKSVRNSPVSISKDTDILGGVVKPFDDTSPLARLTSESATTTDPNFIQRIGDHVAIVIDLDPSEETTIGVERKADGHATGRVTSMAYYNFETKKWETAGKNNDFVIPGAITIMSSSQTKWGGGADEIGTGTAEQQLLFNSVELFSSASVGFTGTSGFTVYNNMGQEALSDLKSRALPTSNYGFPRHKKYEAKTGQKIKMSEYISAPFVLERVSFEYGAAIEESGPHSLGYKLPFVSTDNPDFRRLYPETCHKVTKWKAGVDTAAGDGVYDYSSVRRGEFINGSPAINIGDPSAGFGGATDSSFSNDKSAHINMIINASQVAGGPISTGNDSDLGFFGTFLGSAGGDGNSSQILFVNSVAHPRLSPERTVGAAGGRDYSLMQLTASMFLKSSTGPRPSLVDSTYRQMTELASSRVKPLSVIPVLAGGMNGVVTASFGSSHSGATLNFKDPMLGVLTNDADNGSDDTNRSWYSSEGGTPFWRADTFFLLKEKKTADNLKNDPIKIVANSWAPLYPCAPYLSENNISFDGAPEHGDFFISNGQTPGGIGSLYSQFRIIGSGEGGSEDSMIVNSFRYGPRSSTKGVLSTIGATEQLRNAVQPDGSMLLNPGATSSTTREMITFGQMVHYGYANAPTELRDTLVGQTSAYSSGTGPAGMSGSINPDFVSQISAGGAGTTTSLGSQALKIASLLQGFTNTSIPSNLEHVHNVAKDPASAFSDFPDTAQGQFSSPTDSITRDATWTWRIASAPDGSSEGYNRFIARLPAQPLRQPPSAPPPRYAASGSFNVPAAGFLREQPSDASQLEDNASYTPGTWTPGTKYWQVSQKQNGSSSLAATTVSINIDGSSTSTAVLEATQATTTNATPAWLLSTDRGQFTRLATGKQTLKFFAARAVTDYESFDKLEIVTFNLAGSETIHKVIQLDDDTQIPKVDSGAPLTSDPGSLQYMQLVEMDIPADHIILSFRRISGAADERLYIWNVEVPGQAYGTMNETFCSLDTWALPLILTNAGSRPANGVETIARFSAFMQAENSDSAKGYRPIATDDDNPQSVGTYSPMGSGWSLISSPAYIASETRINKDYLTGSMAEDFARFGSFDRSSEEWQQVLGQKFSSAPSGSWLDSGLSRDLNIRLQPGQTHQGTNPGFNDSFCGFTILTASTAQRPFTSPGRESASLPLQANVYKRQYLNYHNDFKLDVPVRANVNRSAETPGYWTFTANNHRTEVSGFLAGSNFSYFGNSSIQHHGEKIRANATLDCDNKLLTWQRAMFAKRYHLRYSVFVSEGGWDPKTMEGSSRYVASVVAQDPDPASSQSVLALAGLSSFTAGEREGSNASSTKIYVIDDTPSAAGSGASVRSAEQSSPYTNAMAACTISGSFAKKTSEDSMYVLDPADELILGVQPALPGWNPGSGLPNNRHSSKYGIWDMSGSYTAGYPKAWDVDNDGTVIENPYMNLEDPYEPSHGLTMLKTPSRVVLYGTFVRDNKPYDNSSTQIIGSDAVHEAIHYDNPVLDQFNIASRAEYFCSNLEKHFTGSIFQSQRGDTLEGIRGVAGSDAAGTLSISGSLQRFQKLNETGEVFFDTLLQDPVQVAGALGGTIDLSASPTSNVFINMHFPVQESIDEIAGWIQFAQTNSSTSFSVLTCAGWSDSFPFETRFSEVRRSVERSIPGISLQARIDLNIGASDPPDTDPASAPVSGAPGGSPESTGYGTNPFDYFTAMSGSANRIYNPRRRKAASKWVFGDTNASSTNSPAGHTGNAVRHLRNMANVKSVADIVTTDLGGSNYRRLNDARTFRLFGASMIGFGRENRKYLDIKGFGKADALIWNVTGRADVEADFDHPAGFKFGYMNCDHLNPSQIYRSDRHGQFRDRLEQRLYSKTYSMTSEFSSKGETEAAVSCIFVDRSGTPVDDSTTTSCLNLSTAMTASKPFIEGDTDRTIIINTDFVSIDPFSIDLPRLSS